jgi:hypothetical protein
MDNLAKTAQKLREQLEDVRCLTYRRLQTLMVHGLTGTQIWVAITIYVLAAIVKKKLALSIPLYTFLQILSVTVFEKTTLNQLVTDSPVQLDSADSCNQLLLFNL